MLSDCIFCKIISGQIPSKKIAENDDLIVINDIAPKASIHYLIIPKKHIIDLISLQIQDLNIGSAVVGMAHDLAQNLLGSKAFRLISNNGIGAGQSVFHLHFHFLAGAKLPEF